MMQDIALEALRILFLQGLPIVIVLAVAGTIISALQSATAINEPALGYAVRLLALVAALYFILPATIKAILDLTQVAFG